MPAEHSAGFEQRDIPSKQTAKPLRASEELTAEAKKRLAQQAEIRREEAVQQQVEWPPKAEAALLAELDGLAVPDLPDTKPDEDDPFGDFLDDLDEPETEAVESDLDDFLSGVGEDVESAPADPETRTATLKSWILAELPECRPADQAADRCFQHEIENRAIIGPDYSAMEDPKIRVLLTKEFVILEKTARADAMEAVAAETDETVGADVNDLTQTKAETAKQVNSLEECESRSKVGQQKRSDNLTVAE